jgi:transcriptional regulator of acetoin/glycerol metabolism
VNLAQFEKDLVAQALDQANWNVTQAAKLLGISRDTLRYRIEKFQLAQPS